MVYKWSPAICKNLKIRIIQDTSVPLQKFILFRTPVSLYKNSYHSGHRVSLYKNSYHSGHRCPFIKIQIIQDTGVSLQKFISFRTPVSLYKNSYHSGHRCPITKIHIIQDTGVPFISFRTLVPHSYLQDTGVPLQKQWTGYTAAKLVQPRKNCSKIFYWE